ncbi:MAG: hypothetical protein ACFCBV_01665 [Phycisphaerales bacterium]
MMIHDVAQTHRCRHPGGQITAIWHESRWLSGSNGTLAHSGIAVECVHRAVPGAGRRQSQKGLTMKNVLKVSDSGKRIMVLTVLSFIALM